MLKNIHQNIDLMIDNVKQMLYNISCKEQVINPRLKEDNTMSNPNMENKVKELMELKRMKEELEAEITAMEDEIKSVMGDEETLLAGAFKVDWKTVITSRLDTTALKKALPEIAERFMKQTTTRRFCVR